MGPVSGPVRVIPLMEVEAVPLPAGSWSRMAVTAQTAPGTTSSLGYSVFTPGTVTASVRHQVEELAIVLRGRGELRLDAGPVPFRAQDALVIPAGTWHAVANTGDEDVVMVFTFPHPGYPPTERR